MIIGASKEEKEYIVNILNNTKKEILNNIMSVEVMSYNNVRDRCGHDAMGCAEYNLGTDIRGKIIITNLNYYLKGEVCNTFSDTLNHEIGHISGAMKGDESEIYARNYAYDHTNINVVYEDERKC